MEYLINGIIFVLLLLLSALFSGSETAIFHLPKVTVEKISHQFPIIKDRDKLLSSILFGNTLINIGASVIAAKLFYQIFNSENQALITGIMTYIILVCGEFLPKLHAVKHSETISIKVAPALKIVYYIFLPITLPINAFIRIITPASLPHALITREELKVLTECVAEENSITEREKSFVIKLLDFRHKKIKDIMVHMDKIVAMPSEMVLEEDKIANLKYSRIPVYKDRIDQIVGILYLKDLLPQKLSYKAVEIARKPHFVEETMNATDLFLYFQEKRVHIAIVVDENKLVKGLVTLDDILNSIIK